MNVLFALIFLLCNFLLLCTAPESFLPALLNGASKGASICISLVATYSVWMGLMRVWEDSGVTKIISRIIKPVTKWLFKTEDEEALQAINMNVSVNLLGISGAATPYGIKAANLLDKTKNAEYSSAMLFVLNATSIQILPTSIISVRIAMQSVAPNNIIIPTILASALSTVLGVLLTRVFIHPETEENKDFISRPKSVHFSKRKGAGT